MKEIIVFKKEDEKDNIINNYKQRNYGIDLLRIMSMFMVVIQHILGRGGILPVVENNEGKFAMSWLLEITAYCAVNCYALISGFVYFSEKDKPHKISKYIALWLQVEFYSVLITLLFWKFNLNSISIKQIIKSFMPVATDQYWYFTAYTGVFLIMPLLNKIVQGLKKENMKVYAFYILIFTSYVSITNCTFSTDSFVLHGGFCFLWLAILYVIGAYIKKFEIYHKVRKRNALVTAILLIIFTWGWKVGIGKLTMHLLGKKTATNWFVSYTSPTIVGIAVALLLVCAKLKIKSFWQKIIKFIGPAVFGVYLLHEQPILSKSVIINKYEWVADLNAYLIPIAVISNALLIFAIGIVMDKIRILIFKFLKIDKFSQNIENVINKLINKLNKENKAKQEEEKKCTTPIC